MESQQGLEEFIPMAWYEFPPSLIPVTKADFDIVIEQPKQCTALVHIPKIIEQQAIEVIAEEVPKQESQSTALDISKLIPEVYLQKLRPFQAVGVSYALQKKKCFMADEMGLGKTIQTLVAIDISQEYPVLVVCPLSLKYNWQNEINKWLVNKNIQIVGSNSLFKFGLPAFKKKMDFIIINYDGLKNHADEIKKYGFKTIVYDESHYLKNPDAKRTSLAKEITPKEIPQVFCLTGTAVLNRPNEIIQQLRIMDRFSQFGSEYRFKSEFCQVSYDGKLIGGKNLEILNQRLRDSCYIRRKKMDVLKELPDKQLSDIKVEIDNREDYDKAATNLAQFIMDQEIKDEKFLGSIAGLDHLARFIKIQNYKGEKSQRAQMAEHLVRIEILKQVAARGKMYAVYEWIDDFLEESDEKLVVFAHHKEIQQLLMQKYPDSLHIFASDKPEERQRTVDKFQNDKTSRIIVCSLMSAGLGITLTASSTVLTLELGWNPAIHLQAEDRLHRIGQKNCVNSYYFIGIDTIDEWILELIKIKAEIVNATLEGVDSMVQINIYQEIIDRLKRKYGRG